MAEKEYKERFKHFLMQAFEIVQDFLLVALIVVLLRAMRWLTEQLGLPADIRDIIDMLDVCTKLSLLALLSVSLFLRFYKRALVQS